MKTIFRYLRPLAGLVIASVVFLFVQAMTELKLPDLMSELVDTGIIALDGKENQMRFILTEGFKMLGVALISVGAAVTVNYFSTKTAAQFAKRMRHDVFTRVSSFSSAEFNKFSTASLITRTTNDIQQLQNVLAMGVRMICFAPVMGIGSIVMAVRKSPSMSWILGLAVAVLLTMITVIFKISMPKFKIQQKLIDRLNLVSRENLSGMMVIRAFGNEKHEEDRFEVANNNLRKTNRFVQRTVTIMFPFMTILMNATSLMVVWFGAKAIAQSSLEIGDMMAYIQYAMHVIMSFMFVALLFIGIPRALVSANRIGEVLNTEISIKDPDKAETIENPKGVIEFNDVSFKYDNASDCVLEHITFTAQPGQTTAFIGSTGSGKSTLINLIPRLYDVTEGSVTFDGVDVRNMSLHQLRECIGFVPQKGVLFSGSVDSNLKFGKEDADEQELRQALETAQASFVDSMPEGISSEISQGGTNVSGGQRQRLSIARAIVKKPPVYIFDDSFSALDLKTDAALRRALKDCTGSATVLIVAQRVSTIMNAEQIIVLDEGRIVGKGTHSELIKTCPQYLEIAESQLTKEELQ